MTADIWVDFNDIDERRQVLTLERFARPGVVLQTGDSVWAADDEGNRCKAYVVEITKGVVRLQLDLGSFEADAHSAPHAALA